MSKALDMPSRPARVSVSIAADPSLVRTVRLIAAAAARRAARDEDLVEEVRLAVGEACALLLAASTPSLADEVPARRDDTVTVQLAWDEQLSVEVVSSVPVPAQDDPHGDVDGVEPWALLRGLIDTLSINEADTSTRVSMSWPLG